MALDAIQQTALDLDNAIDAYLSAAAKARDAVAASQTASAALAGAQAGVKKARDTHDASINAKLNPSPAPAAPERTPLAATKE